MVNNKKIFENPVGSTMVWVANGIGETKMPVSQTAEDYHVVGLHGRVRHRGSFSEDNPYLSQLRLATNNKDKDALYERAVEWEADYANLLEQRDYDDPINQIARQRSAGINPDISGGSSGGTSSGSSAQIADQSAQSQFSNVSGNIADATAVANTVFSGISTVTGSIDIFTNALNSINNFREAKRTFGKRQEILSDQARLTNISADIAEDTQSSTIQSTNAQNGINVANSLLAQSMQLASLFSPEMDETQRINFCKALGYSEEQAKQVVSSVSALSSSPHYKDFHNRQQMLLQESEGMKGHYTTTYYDLMSGFTTQFNLDVAQQNTLSAKFSKLITSLTATDENAENIATAEKIANAVNVEKQNLIKDEIRSVLNSINSKLKYRASLVDKLEKEKSTLESKYARTGNSFFDTFLPDMPPEVEARIDALENQINAINTRSNSELDEIYQQAMQFASTRYLSTQTTNRFGGANITFANKMYEYQHSVIFGDYRNKNGQSSQDVDLAGRILDIIF